jgi:hypothetical protein
MKDLEALQKKHVPEILPWRSFISKATSFRISAFNDCKRIIRLNVLQGTELDLDNADLLNLIMRIVLPTNEQDWIDDFKRLVKFRKLERNQQEATPDVTRYDSWYDAIIEMQYEANQVYDFLTSIDDLQVAPDLMTYSGKPGLMQIFHELIPQQAGKHLHAAIIYSSLKACPSFRQYTVLLQAQNQLIQNGSDITKQARAKMNKVVTPLNAERQSHSHPGTSAYSNRNNPAKYDNNNNNNRNNINKNYSNHQIVPYTNPHQGRLNNITDMYNDAYHNYEFQLLCRSNRSRGYGERICETDERNVGVSRYSPDPETDI